MSALAPLVLVSRRVLDYAVIFGTLTATAVGIIVTACLLVVVAKLSHSTGKTTRLAASPSSPPPGSRVAAGGSRP